MLRRSPIDHLECCDEKNVEDRVKLLTDPRNVSRRLAMRRKRAKGICAFSGCLARSRSRAYCELHRAVLAEAQKDLRARKKLAGFCVQSGCGSRARAGRVYCSRHATRRQRYMI